MSKDSIEIIQAFSALAEARKRLLEVADHLSSIAAASLPEDEMYAIAEELKEVVSHE
jgi:hypothetical protein